MARISWLGWRSCLDLDLDLIEVEKRDDLLLLLGLVARLQQQPAVVEGKADHLLHVADDALVADPASTAAAAWRTRSECATSTARPSTTSAQLKGRQQVVVVVGGPGRIMSALVPPPHGGSITTSRGGPPKRPQHAPPPPQPPFLKQLKAWMAPRGPRHPAHDTRCPRLGRPHPRPSLRPPLCFPRGGRLHRRTLGPGLTG